MRFFFCLFSMTFLAGCLRLDDNLFDQSKISAYLLNNYPGEVDFRLNSSYAIADSMTHLFPLASKGPEDAVATIIYAVYIGDVRRILTDTVIMYCHGNKDHMDFYWPRAQLLANTGKKHRYGLMMIDYRGYGMSEGKPSEKGLYADVNAALTWLKGMGLTDDRLVIYGFSMGTAPATKLAAGKFAMHPSKLLLEAPFASAEVMVQDAIGLALPGMMVTDLKINNGEEIRKVSQPFCWIHGEADDFLNINTHGAVVYEHYQGIYKEGHRIPGAGHSTIQTTMGFEKYLDAVGKFIETH